MIHFLILNSLLSIFLLVTIYENKINLTYISFSKLTSYLFFLLFIIGVIFALPSFLSPTLLLSKFLLFIFISLIAGHFAFLCIHQKLGKQLLLFIIFICIFAYYTFRPSMLSQDIFILSALVWLGPFFVKRGIFSPKRIFIFMCVWLGYNVLFFVFRSFTMPFFHHTQTTRMPFSVLVGNSSLGVVDLIVPNLLLSLLKSIKLQFITIAIFLSINLFVGLLSFQWNMFVVFPISLVWFMLFIPLFFLDTKLQKSLGE